MAASGHSGRMSGAADNQSEFGGLFEEPTAGASVSGQTGVRAAQGTTSAPVERQAPSVAVGFGRGPVQKDPRKYRYDTVRGAQLPQVPWSASKADRMDALDAGDMLNSIHEMFNIDREREDRIKAFDEALWFQHTINGASQLQPGRGAIVVDGQAFDIQAITDKLGIDARRFFRAFADDIAEVNRAVLDAYDPYDEVSCEKAGIIRSVAEARGLRKFPYLAHDSSDACVRTSVEERNAILVAKRYYLPQRVNAVDALPPVEGEVV